MEWLYVSPSIHHLASVITTSWSLLFSPHHNCSHESILQLIPDVASSLCKYFFISTKTAVVKRQLQQHYQIQEISNHDSPPNAQAVWRLSWYCIFTVCLNKDYDLPASLDHRIVSDACMVMSCIFAMGSPLPRFRPSVFGWWLPLLHPPCLLRLPDTAHGLLLRPGSDLCLMIAVLPSYDSQTVRYLEGHH